MVVSSLSQVGAIAPQSLESLLESIQDCLASTCWVTRKAAADTLIALASHSSSLIKDKTYFTLAVLENCQFDKVATSSSNGSVVKIEAVSESVTEALQLWKRISGKCVGGASDESKISSGEHLRSEKNGEKRMRYGIGYGVDVGYGTLRYVWYEMNIGPPFLSTSEIESAYEEIFGTGDKGSIISLMEKTGAIFDRLSSTEIANKIIKFISQLLVDHNDLNMCLDWLRELQEELVKSGTARFGVLPMEQKKVILYNLQTGLSEDDSVDAALGTKAHCEVGRCLVCRYRRKRVRYC